MHPSLRLPPAGLLAMVAALAAGITFHPERASPQASTDLAGGGLLVAPTRVILEGHRRSANVTLVNRGAERATYRIGFVQMEMTAEGRLLEIDDATEDRRFANDLVRYAPRQVTLAPGESQTVRLQVRKPADLAPGEYRSHFLFRYVPPTARASRTRPDPAGVSIQLTPVYGASIPVIVRHGETSATVAIGGVEILRDGAEGAPTLKVHMRRAGNRSVYGDLQVSTVSREGTTEVGRVRGLAIYAGNPERIVEVPLNDRASDLAAKDLRLTFESREPGQVGKTLATRSFSVR